MTNLETELRKLSQVELDEKFCRDAKARLMHQVVLHKNESWFTKLIKRITPDPSVHFIKVAKVRLMARITSVKQPFISWMSVLKRVTASTLVMLLAVTTTFFFAGEKQPAEASYNTYLQIVSGEVKVKHSNKMVWDVATTSMQMTVGDLISLKEGSSAIVHFFDDTELRLTGNSSLLFNRLDASSGFAQQGVIDVSLQQGKAWVQVLSIDDGFAQFTLTTTDASSSTVNGTFDVQTSLVQPTQIRVFKNSVNVKAITKEKREVYAVGKLNVAQKINIDSSKRYSKGIKKLASIANITDLTSEDRNAPWVKNNIEADKKHLLEIREREIVSLKNSTGLLPGQVLYPLKRAKERLHLALKDEADEINYKINIANKRLNESIILLEQGDSIKAKEALGEYQMLVNEVSQQSKANKAQHNKLSNRVLITHQKTLVARLPGDTTIGIVKDVLDETEQLLEEDPVKKAEIKLKNSLEDLVSIQDYVTAGNLVEAQKKLKEHKIITSTLAKEGIDFKSDGQKKDFYENLLEAQDEERRVLNEIDYKLADQSADHKLVLLVQSKDADMDKVIKKTATEIKPVVPDVNLKKIVKLPKNEKAKEFAEKIAIYSSLQGQKNQIHRLFDEYPGYARDVEFLSKLENKLDLRAKELVNIRILQIENEKAVALDREMQLKLDRARGFRE